MLFNPLIYKRKYECLKKSIRVHYTYLKNLFETAANSVHLNLNAVT